MALYKVFCQAVEYAATGPVANKTFLWIYRNDKTRWMMDENPIKKNNIVRYHLLHRKLPTCKG